ncbi:unnamed protein product, partial [Allacma fusca]
LFEANVFSSLSVIKLRLQHIEETQELILEQLKTSKGSSLKSILNLPVVSLAALESLEETLMSQEDVYNELANKLDWVGGKSVRECTFKTMRKLMSDEVAATLNWKGGNSKA